MKALQIAAAAMGLQSGMLFASVPFTWELEIDRLTTGPVVLHNISASNTGTGMEDASINIAIPTVEGSDVDYAAGPVAITCPGSTLRVIENLCRAGKWSLNIGEEWPQLEGILQDITNHAETLQARLEGTLGELTWEATLSSAEVDFSGEVSVPEQGIEALGFIEEKAAPFSWISAGRIQANIAFSQHGDQELAASADLILSGVDFDSPDGLYAGLGVALDLSVRSGRSVGVNWSIGGELSSGELLLMDFYRDFSNRALRLEARAEQSEKAVDISRFEIADGDALQVIGQAAIPLEPEGSAHELVLRELHMQFPLAYERYLESSASVLGLDGLRTAGSVSWTGDWSPGSARSGVLKLERLTVIDQQNERFAIKGLDGSLMTGTESRLTWDSISFEKMNLGGGQAALSLSPEQIALTKPLTIDVFGGYLDLEEFSFTLPREGEPDVKVRASVSDIEMQQMSRALGWPEFGGTLSGRIPGIRWTGEVVEIDGALQFQVFGGEVLLTDLRVERPFGVLPSMAANITATDLDLEELTRIFEFGRIGGRADGYVRDLRMLDWQPVHFDAWFGTAENEDGKHGISRKAVQHLAQIGGGSPTAVLSGPILSLFNNFSYRRLGLGCELRNNVCRIRGIEEHGEAVLLLEGAGIPKISIQAYNRSVDWPQLVAGLTAVSSGEEIRIGD